MRCRARAGLSALAKAWASLRSSASTLKIEFPIGLAMELSVQINCNANVCRRVRIGEGYVDPLKILTHREPLMGALEAYAAFDTRQPGWIKVELKPERR